MKHGLLGVEFPASFDKLRDREGGFSSLTGGRPIAVVELVEAPQTRSVIRESLVRERFTVFHVKHRDNEEPPDSDEPGGSAFQNDLIRR